MITLPFLICLCYFNSGDKSEVLDIDNPDLNKYPEFARATRYEGVLEAGDILFIPGKSWDSTSKA